jgi:hypothetical protein
MFPYIMGMLRFPDVTVSSLVTEAHVVEVVSVIVWDRMLEVKLQCHSNSFSCTSEVTSICMPWILATYTLYNGLLNEEFTVCGSLTEWTSVDLESLPNGFDLFKCHLCHLKLPCCSRCWCHLTVVCLFDWLWLYFWRNLHWTVMGNLNSSLMVWMTPFCTNSYVTCVVVLLAVTSTTLGQFLHFSLQTTCMYLHREWSSALLLLAVFISDTLCIIQCRRLKLYSARFFRSLRLLFRSLCEMESKNVAFTRIIFD